MRSMDGQKKNQVPNTSGKKALAMEAYARALRQLPTIIADNGGYDGSDLISSLRAAHAQGAKVRWRTKTRGDGYCCRRW